MIDRFGNKVQVSYAEHEILWIKAALSLGRDDRTAAFQDIAAMTGRTEFQIRKKAIEIRAKQRADFERVMASAPRRVMVPARSYPRLIPSELRQPTKAQLMGCR